MACDRAMAEPGFNLQSDLSRRQTASLCAGLAEVVLEDAPSHGFAHLIAATAAHVLLQHGRMADHLAASQFHARHEGWLAERRFLLLQAANPALRDRLLRSDIAVLLTTQSGARMLSETLATASPLRDVVLAQADKASPADRQRLLNIVRQRAGDV